MILAPNNYSLDSMMGKTIRSGKSQLPIFTMRPKYKTGAFYEDLAKVIWWRLVHNSLG